MKKSIHTSFSPFWWHLLRPLFSNFLYGMKLLLRVANLFLNFWNISMLWENQRETADVVVNPLSLRGKHHHGWVKENKLPKKRDTWRSHFRTNLSKNNWSLTFSRPFSFQEPLRYTTPQESRSIRPYDVILDNRATIGEEDEWQPIYK